MTTYEGIGENWSETGTEGIIWCVLKNTKETDKSWSYDNLVPLQDNDYLIIFDKIDSTKIVWEGSIKFETNSHQETNDYGFTGQAVFNMWCHGLQDTPDKEQWALYFFKHYPMRLTRNV